MVKKKIFAAAAALAIGLANICSGDAQPLIGSNFTVSAESSGEKMTYGDLTYTKRYRKFDYIEIIDCEESVTEIDIPGEIDGLPVLAIGEYAFENCADLKSVTIPDSVLYIYNGAFWDCLSLSDITIPESVIYFAQDAYLGCKNLININVSEYNKEYSSENGVLFDKNKTALIKYPEGKKEEEYIIPKGVVDIYPSAFAECSALTSVTIPYGIMTVGSYSFAMCSGLTSVTIPDSVTTIGRYAFCLCSSLKEITIKGRETCIEEEAGFGTGTISNGEGYYNGIIRGYRGSKAQEYANEKGYKFKSLDKKIQGDISDNGKIDIYDAIEIAKYIVGKRTFTEEEMEIADVKKDGVINLYDAIRIAEIMIENSKK